MSAFTLKSLLLSLVLVSTSSFAEDAIKNRIQLMKDIGGNMQRLSKSLKGDLATINALAKEMKENAEKIEAAFKKKVVEGPTDSKPNIWTEWDKFSSAAKILIDKSDELANLKDKSKVMTVFAPLGKMGCGTCHSQFRKDKKDSYKNK